MNKKEDKITIILTKKPTMNEVFNYLALKLNSDEVKDLFENMENEELIFMFDMVKKELEERKIIKIEKD